MNTSHICKVMETVFWDAKGLLLIDYLPLVSGVHLKATVI